MWADLGVALLLAGRVFTAHGEYELHILGSDGKEFRSCRVLTQQQQDPIIDL